MLKKIPGNVEEDSGECSRGFQGMFEEIPGNIRRDSVEYTRKFRGMLKKISGNLNLDLFCEILLILLICKKTKEYFLRY